MPRCRSRVVWESCKGARCHAVHAVHAVPAHHFMRCTRRRSRRYSKSPVVCRNMRPLRTRFSLKPTLQPARGTAGQDDEGVSKAEPRRNRELASDSSSRCGPPCSGAGNGRMQGRSESAATCEKGEQPMRRRTLPGGVRRRAAPPLLLRWLGLLPLLLSPHKLIHQLALRHEAADGHAPLDLLLHPVHLLPAQLRRGMHARPDLARGHGAPETHARTCMHEPFTHTVHSAQACMRHARACSTPTRAHATWQRTAARP